MLTNTVTSIYSSGARLDPGTNQRGGHLEKSPVNRCKHANHVRKAEEVLVMQGLTGDHPEGATVMQDYTYCAEEMKP